METVDFIETLRRDGKSLVDLATSAGWDAKVPTCPGWLVRDLVAHTGSVHRWATGYLAGMTRRVPIEPCAPQNAEDLAPWFRDGHGALVDALTAAPVDLECWTFLPAPTPLSFWARRQAHETAIHRVDAESAAGAEHTEFSPEFARDGIDELLTGFHVRSKSRVRTEQPRTLLVEATDPGSDPAQPSAWLLRLSEEPPRVERLTDADAEPTDCVVRGPSQALYLALWNRGRRQDLDVTGDASLAELWHSTSAV
ncbi:maleylpyruvate isomerase family mycothiol-dependent enzyme [Streptomyces phyllanthi]|uniref:Maleylpyruvate isomerase family mycothiol-dependent enzyme n=1 Tax=Streptomyces phyllanthi TaxID=1803180 RepID=A0A5N8W5P2_9ACTN|nr:maleylpyruvate isomerase family mycothiol-dependent enzyme [Streptomyces phyllanthi]MPY41455.1 maleylpyruvate isomerase family mycothiol-dependent enzyme [Streptomyces phyllanthi]